VWSNQILTTDGLHSSIDNLAPPAQLKISACPVFVYDTHSSAFPGTVDSASSNNSKYFFIFLISFFDSIVLNPILFSMNPPTVRQVRGLRSFGRLVCIALLSDKTMLLPEQCHTVPTGQTLCAPVLKKHIRCLLPARNKKAERYKQ
jgi:hypothetical protein